MSLKLSPLYANEARDSNTMNILTGYEDLGVSPLLENNQVAKRCRYLNPHNTIWPMGYGLITSSYKYKHKKPIVNNNNFDTLPEEIILHVFKMLDKRTLTKCAYVCRQWRRIACDESLWQCLNIPCRRMSIMALDNLLKRNIKFISLSHANIYVDTMYTFETPLPKLQYLDMSAVFMKVDILNSLLKQCCNLVKLSLENCQVDHACCKDIGRNTKLKVLNVASTSGLDIIGLKHILSLKSLEELNISWAHLNNTDLHFLLANMVPSVKRLNISGFLKQLADYDIISLVSCCPNLIELDVSDSLSITATSFNYILNNLPNLKVLSMSRCYNFGSTFLLSNEFRMKMINNTTHRLQELNMFGITNQSLFNFLCDNLLDFEINKNIFSSIARPKPADNENTIWEIPICIDC